MKRKRPDKKSLPKSPGRRPRAKDKRPSPAVSNGGRDLATGRFSAANRFGRGNPFAARVQRLRAAFLEAVQPGDVKRIIRMMIALAVAGDVAAAIVVLRWALGSPPPMDVTEGGEEQRIIIVRTPLPGPGAIGGAR